VVGREQITEVSGRRFLVRDAYGVEVAPEQDDTLIILQSRPQTRGGQGARTPPPSAPYWSPRWSG